MLEGRPVSLVGMAVCDVKALGCRTKIGCIGSVCTDESARGGGLAERLVSDAVDRARRQNVSVMLISGHRSLYASRGAVRAGLFHRYTFAAGDLADGEADVAAAELAEGEVQIALEMHVAEPVRFVNSEKDYLAMIASGQTMNRPGKTHLVRRGGRCVAVASVNFSYDGEDKNVLGVREMAGCRRAVLSALPQIVAQAAPTVRTVQIDSHAADEQMRSACAAMGAAPEDSAHRGTVLLVDPRRLLRDFTPLLAERIGPRAAMLRVQPMA